MALKHVLAICAITQTEVAAKFSHASPLDHLGAAR